MTRAQRATDRAAQFIIEQGDGAWNDARQAALDAWLSESDGNKAAYWRLKHSWREADRIGALGPVEAVTGQDNQYRGVRWWLPTAVAATIAVLLGTEFARRQDYSSPPQSQAVAYVTPIGGRRDVGFSDGTRIQLNTASRLRASVTPRHREVWLEQGEAFFEVAHREDSPFIVHAGDRKVTVLGTKFSVRREGAKVTVTVLQGRVRVDEVGRDPSVRSTVIVAGDIALAQGAATLVMPRSQAVVENALAWRSGMLEYDQTQLSDVIADFNRYNVKQIVVTDPKAARIRIGGMFPSSDVDAFVRLLHDAYGLKVEESEKGIRISSGS
ncbi:MAG: FecR domain-containing protein [Sphingobium limneticum]|jgi:transmembrane sensor